MSQDLHAIVGRSLVILHGAKLSIFSKSEVGVPQACDFLDLGQASHKQACPPIYMPSNDVGLMQ